MQSITSSPNYLCRNPYSFCFRMKVPKDLQNILPKKELKYSLQTGNLSTAKSKSRFVAGQVQLFFRGVRKGEFIGVNLSKEQIQSMIKKFMQKTIESYDKPVTCGQDDEGILRQAHWEGRSTKDEIKELEWIKDDLNTQIHKGDYSDITKQVDDMLVENGKANIDKSSSVYAELCTGILSAQIKGIEYRQKRLGGELRNDLDDLLQSCLPGENQPKVVVPQNASHEIPVQPKPERKKISEVIPLYVDEAKVNWKPKTEQEVIASLNLLIEVVGDVPIQSVNRAKVAEYKNVLKNLPPNKNKIRKYRSKSIPELVKMPKEKTLSVERINKNLERAGQLFEYAILHGIYEGPNPATKMQVPKDKHASQKRAPYTNEELELLFRSEGYLQDTFSRHYMFWALIIALFHGMRQNEVAKLLLEDIKETEDGIPYFDDIYSRKSDPTQAYRVAPVHPFLLEELNFRAYVESIRSQGHKQLFPECKKGRDGYGKAVSNWFNSRYKKKCGIVSPDGRYRDFHSLRTTFITRLRHKKVHLRMLKEVVGHSVHIDVTDTYTDPYPIKDLLEQVVSLANFHKEIDLSHLKNSKFVIK